MTDITDLVRLLDREIWLLTSAHQQRQGGLIATFVSQASIVPAMPRMLVGIARQHHTWQLIEASRAFTLHLLDETHLEWVWQFGLQTGHTMDKFAALSVTVGVLGTPHLPGVSWLDCRVETSMGTGDRSLYLAEVVAAQFEQETRPLTMQRLLQLAPADRLSQLRQAMQRDISIDAAAIQSWRSSLPG